MARRIALLGERESLAVKVIRVVLLAVVTTLVTAFAVAVVVVAATD